VDFDEKLAGINVRLKAARVGVAIARKKNWLWLRATLPPKPHIDKPRPYQQEVSLHLKATPAGLQSAFIKAKQMGLQLESGSFSWYEWLGIEDERGKISYWLEKFEDDYWGKISKTESSFTTWTKDYRSTFNKLDCDHDLSLNYLIEVVHATEPNSRSRLKVCTYLHKLGQFAGVKEIEKIKELKGDYSPSSVQPRALPSDALIASCRDSIDNEAWRWVFGAIAVYGLRNHEVFHLDLSEFPMARVLKSKTGERFIYPLYPEWADVWLLYNKTLPNIDPSYSNAKLGTKVSNWFRGKFSFKCYDLRHCYARRCFEFGLTPDWAAGLMGHSIAVHTNTYRAWIDEATYRKAYEAVINRDGRPLPPG
jgi:integrase